MSEQAPAAPRARLVAHAVLAGIGLVALAISLRLGLWRQSSPGEGLFPFLTALAMVMFSVAGLVRDWLRREAAAARAGGDRAGLIRRVAERYPWAATLALTAGTVIGCQVLFVLWLGAMLPTGTLWADVFQ